MGKSKFSLALVAAGLFILSACDGAPEEPTPVPSLPSVTPVAVVVESASATPLSNTPTAVPAPTMLPEEEDMHFELTSTGFQHESPIPVKYSCDGENTSPPLMWNDPPQGTLSLALIHDDPDAPGGTWIHWVLYNIPAAARELREAIPAQAALDDGSLHGENSWGRLDYGGPCPPGGEHRYFFKLYALDLILDLASGASKADLIEAMEGHILAETELMGTFSR